MIFLKKLIRLEHCGERGHILTAGKVRLRPNKLPPVLTSKMSQEILRLAHRHRLSSVIVSIEIVQGILTYSKR